MEKRDHTYSEAHSREHGHHRNPEAHYAVTDRLTAEGRSELGDSDFGLPRERKFPMPDAAHVRAADGQKPELARRIMHKAGQFGVEVHSENVLRWARS